MGGVNGGGQGCSDVCVGLGTGDAGVLKGLLIMIEIVSFTQSKIGRTQNFENKRTETPLGSRWTASMWKRVKLSDSAFRGGGAAELERHHPGAEGRAHHRHKPAWLA